jgi:ribosomal protein L33
VHTAKITGKTQNFFILAPLFNSSLQTKLKEFYTGMTPHSFTYSRKANSAIPVPGLTLIPFCPFKPDGIHLKNKIFLLDKVCMGEIYHTHKKSQDSARRLKWFKFYPENRRNGTKKRAEAGSALFSGPVRKV